MPSLFEELGGHDKLEKIVAQFYQYVLNDERVNYFFLENVSDIPKLHSTMVLFLTFLFGGPNHYKGPDMVNLHKNMPIRPEHYEITWEHMEAAFLVYKLSGDLIKRLKEAVYTTREDIINAYSMHHKK